MRNNSSQVYIQFMVRLMTGEQIISLIKQEREIAAKKFDIENWPPSEDQLQELKHNGYSASDVFEDTETYEDIIFTEEQDKFHYLKDLINDEVDFEAASEHTYLIVHSFTQVYLSDILKSNHALAWCEEDFRESDYIQITGYIQELKEIASKIVAKEISFNPTKDYVIFTVAYRVDFSTDWETGYVDDWNYNLLGAVKSIIETRKVETCISSSEDADSQKKPLPAFWKESNVIRYTTENTT